MNQDFKKLIKWSNENFSHLPWRKKRSLYGTWISEVMLQQTTVHTVKSRLDIFLQKFPSIKSLSLATDDELLVAWKGLGYYQRAKNLKKAALKITNEFKGKFPSSLDELTEIPGIGPYTSSAIYSIGMNKKSLAVDSNLERVLGRYYGIETPKGPKLKTEITNLFNESKILSEKNISSWRELNESLMDLGREICQSRKAYCEICPLEKNCYGRKSGKPLSYPKLNLKEKENKIKFNLHLLRVVCRSRGKIYCYKKKKGEWLAGQYELPTFICMSEDKDLKQYMKSPIRQYEDLPFIKTGITKYKISNYILELGESSFRKKFRVEYFELRNEEDVFSQLSTASLKVLKKRERRYKPDSVVGHHSSRK